MSIKKISDGWRKSSSSMKSSELTNLVTDSNYVSSTMKTSLLGNEFIGGSSSEDLESVYHSVPEQLNKKSFFKLLKEAQSGLEEVSKSIKKVHSLSKSLTNEKETENNFNEGFVIKQMIEIARNSLSEAKNTIDQLKSDTERLKLTAVAPVDIQEVSARMNLLNKIYPKLNTTTSEFKELEAQLCHDVGDRLHELKKSSNDSSRFSFRLSTNGEIERNTAGFNPLITNDHISIQDKIQDFFQDVDTIQKYIRDILDATKLINDIHNQVLDAATTEQEINLNFQLTPLIKDTNKKATLAKQHLEAINKINKNLQSIQKSKSPEQRIRENLTQTLMRKYVETMKAYQAAQRSYKIDIKKKVKRQVQILKPDVTSEEVDQIMTSEGGSSNLYRSAILKGDASDSIKAACGNINAKYQDILALEASVSELYDLFRDFALLTETQGALLDQIEHQVDEAKEHIEESNILLTESIQIQKSIRWKQCCVAMIVLIIIIIIIAAVGAKFG